MMIFIGLFMVIPTILIIAKAMDIKTKKITKILYDILLFLMILIYIIICFAFPSEPFIFNILDPVDYILFSACIYLFTPFMWIITFYYMRNLLKKIRVRKNSKIKNNKFEYYRDDLDKIAPNTIMFTSMYDVDYKKSIASTLMKLKLTGYIKEKGKKLILTDKSTDKLLVSEKMVLDLIKTDDLDKTLYRKTIEKEAIDNKYVKKNKSIITNIIKIILVIIINISMYIGSMKLDDYVFENYHIITEKSDNKKYIWLKNIDDIDDIFYKTEEKDYKKIYYVDSYNFGNEKRINYNYNKVKPNALQYSVVRKAILLNILVPITILLCIVGSFITLYIVIDQLININKKYRRTLKGKELLNKAYALKNFLKDFSLIKNRTEKELILWEYYLVYASILGVNVKINDEVIEKYIKIK